MSGTTVGSLASAGAPASVGAPASTTLRGWVVDPAVGREGAAELEISDEIGRAHV